MRNLLVFLVLFFFFFPLFLPIQLIEIKKALRLPTRIIISPLYQCLLLHELQLHLLGPYALISEETRRSFVPTARRRLLYLQQRPLHFRGQIKVSLHVLAVQGVLEGEIEEVLAVDVPFLQEAGGTGLPAPGFGLAFEFDCFGVIAAAT